MNPIKIVKKLHITLLELLLVLALLGMVGGFFAINVRAALYEQRFRAEVDRVVDHLRLAQDLMLIFDGDVSLNIIAAKDDSGFEYGLVFDHDLPSHLSERFQKKQKLTAIHRINFYPPDPNDKSPGLNIKFYSGGAVMSRGILRLSTAERDLDGALSRYICLPGYPGIIESVSNYLSEEDLLKDEAFDGQLTQRMKDEIHVQEE